MTYRSIGGGIGAEYRIRDVLASGAQTNPLGEEISDLSNNCFFPQLRTSPNNVQSFPPGRQNLSEWAGSVSIFKFSFAQ
jgi:hypothetical protein